jgi:hypothetical protein
MRNARLLSSAQRVVVLVELARPMKEDALGEFISWDNSEWKRFFLSKVQRQSKKPIYWWPGWNGCSAMAIPSNDCANRSVVKDFRQWVGQFKEADNTNLARIGLDLRQLRSAAAEGLIYGFIVTRTGGDLVKLLARPEIRTATVIEVVTSD